MKIAYFTGEYPRATDTFIQREVMGLRDLGIEVETFAVRKPSTQHAVGAEQQAERERTHYLLPPNVVQLLWSHLVLLIGDPSHYIDVLKLAFQTSQPGVQGLLYQIFYFAEAGLLAQQLKSKGISHIHNHIANSSCTVAMLAAALGKVPFSFTMHGPHIFFEPRRWRLDEKIKRAKFVACIGYFCRSQGMIFAPIEHWSKMTIVRCGLDLDLFQPVTHEGQGNRLLYVGRLAVEKGLPVVLDSLSQLVATQPDITLTVVGDGADRPYLEQLTQDMGLQDQVEFVGYQSQAAVRNYLKETDIFVLPSFAEGIPVVLMEAMAMGVPVVATQIAGISELVEPGKSGYLVAPGKPESLAAAIAKLVTDADHRNQLGQCGRQKIEEEFNIKDTLHQLKTWFSAEDVTSLARKMPQEKTQEPSLSVSTTQTADMT